MSFSQLGLPDTIVKGVRAAGYSTPTPIQAQAIPIILDGRDLVGASQTGTGKTAAFLLPILSRLMRHPGILKALVLVPTRELAAQVEANARTYARFTRVQAAAVFGGVPVPPQERMLRNEGVDLLIATPGRLLDLHGRQSVTFEDIEIVVLDEADRMVDMGFAPDLKRILKLLPRDRQTLMFSATMPPELNPVADEALDDPHRLDLGERSVPAPAIAQLVYPVARTLKRDLLSHLLDQPATRKAIVFTRSKRGADRLAADLKKRGHSVAALHGDRSQSQRERALRDFRRGRVPVLVATDIASRGIDVDDVTHVINFDLPRAPEDYVHRIGRTGRMHAAGEAITLVSAEDHEVLRDIEKFLGKRMPRVGGHGFDDAPVTPSRRGAHAESPAGTDAARPARSRASHGHGPAAHHGGRDHDEPRESARKTAPRESARTTAPRESARTTAPRKPAASHAPRAAATEESAESTSHGRRRRLDPPGRRGTRRL